MRVQSVGLGVLNGHIKVERINWYKIFSKHRIRTGEQSTSMDGIKCSILNSKMVAEYDDRYLKKAREYNNQNENAGFNDIIIKYLLL